MSASHALTAVARDALVAEFSKSFGGRRLNKRLVVDPLVKYYADRGESLSELSLDICMILSYIMTYSYTF